jgi:hypothetical protein
MSEETGAESVTSTETPVAIDPSQLNKPVHPETQAVGSADGELLKHKLGLANQHAKQAKKDADDARAELNQLKQELEEQKALQQSAAQKNLEDQGAFKQLWEDAKRTVNQRDAEIVELKAQLASVTEERSRDQLKAAAMSQINSAGVINSQQMYLLLQSALRTDDEGNPAVLNGGVEQPLGDYLANLKQSADWQHHFGASGSKGMNAAGTVSVAPGRENPYRNGNLTEAIRLEVENPQLAKALKSEARKG